MPYYRPTISICWSRQVSPDFHARFSATSRRYRYIFYNNKVKPAILSNLVTHHYRTLDEEAMHEAAQLLLGENDFTLVSWCCMPILHSNEKHDAVVGNQAR